MKFLESYGDTGKHLSYPAKCRIEGHVIPETYLKNDSFGNKILNDDLLKDDVTRIIDNTPVNVLSFERRRGVEYPSITLAKVTEFFNEDSRITARAFPRYIDLEFNTSFEMIEPDLSHKYIDYFRALPDNVIIGFEMENKPEYNTRINAERLPVCVTIKRFQL